MKKQKNTSKSSMLEELNAVTKTYGLGFEECAAIEYKKKYYEDSRSVSIEALKIVQKNRGWISKEAIASIAKVLGITHSDVEEVATFYSHIFRRPVGRYVIRYCDSVVCYITGYQKIQARLEELLNIKPGHTTLDGKFTLLPTCCLGNCDKGPTMMVNDNTHVHLTLESIPLILEQYK